MSPSIPPKPTKSNPRRTLTKMETYEQLNPNIPIIPQELIIEILLKLPHDDLFRCKFASKYLNSLMSSHQDFIKVKYAHQRLIFNTVESGLISCSLYDVLFGGSVDNAINLEPLEGTWPKCVSIVGSSNGKVCILNKADDTLFIYNPSTGRTDILPRPEQEARLFVVSYGFGYDETTHDCKVVRLWRSDRTSPRRGTMIYSLEDKTWKDISSVSQSHPPTFGKFFNGTLHWADGDYGYSWHIVSFDLGQKTFGDVAKPEFNEDEDEDYYEVGVAKKLTLGVLGEFLCVLYDSSQRHAVDVWVMKKDSWFKLTSIPYPTDIGSAHTLDPLWISINCKVLLVFGSKLLVYDLEERSSTMIDNFGECRQACVVV